MTTLTQLPEILLMGPGPSCVYDEVYEALSRPTLGHLDPLFLEIMDEIRSQLSQVFQAGSDTLTMPLSGTGSSGMEAAFANMIEPGDTVLILVNGVFGVRMVDVAGRLGAEVDAIEFEWGTPVLSEPVQTKLKAKRYKLVGMVHAETSTGVANPVEPIARILDTLPDRPLLLLDCVTSLGGMPVKLDEWGVDIAYSGTQKCLSCPPGLAPFALSKRAVDQLMARKTKVPNWYLDVTMLVKYWEAGGGGGRVYHHTAPINMLYGLHTALRVILEEGLEAGFARHSAAHDQLVQGLEDLDLELLVDPEYRLLMLNAVKVPVGIDEAAVRRVLRQHHHIEIGAGLGPLAGKVWRIGLMGHTARAANVKRVLEALRLSLD